MAHNSHLLLNVARRGDFPAFHGLLFLLITMAVLNNPHAQITGIIAAIVMAMTAYRFFAAKHEARRSKLTLVIFPDGSVRIKCTGLSAIEGILGRCQWCTHRIAVLRVVTRHGRRSFLLLAGQQNAHDFRRLNVWLRQKIRDPGQER